MCKNTQVKNLKKGKASLKLEQFSEILSLNGYERIETKPIKERKGQLMQSSCAIFQNL